MPTYELTQRFRRDFERLTVEQRLAFKRAVEHFVSDLQSGRFRAGLRVKAISGLPGCFEMTWAPDGRAIFTYGTEIQPGNPHVVWLAVGTHSILP